MNKEKFGWGCVQIIGICFFIGATIYMFQNEDVVKEVECYDKHNNVIEGLSCTQEGVSDEVGIFVLIGVILLLGGALMFNLVHEVDDTWGMGIK